MKEALTMMQYNPIDGNYLTRRFKEIFPSTESFIQELDSAEFPYIEEIMPQHKRAIYSLLYARYGNSCIASYDEHQFKYGLWSIIFMYGPTWVRRLGVQSELRHLTLDEISSGSKAIYNSAVNPSSAPSTATLEELNYINQQNVTKHKKGKVEAFAQYMQLLETDVTEEFIAKFKKLFITIVQPDTPLWYITTPEEQQIIDGE